MQIPHVSMLGETHPLIVWHVSQGCIKQVTMLWNVWLSQVDDENYSENNICKYTFLLDDASFSLYGAHVLGVLLLTFIVTVTILVCLVIRRQRKISPSVEGG